MDRPVQSREHAEKPVEPFDAGMRERETIAQTGRAQLLANLQGVEDHLRIEVQQSGSARCEILQQLLFIARAGGKNYPVRWHEDRQIHAFIAMAFSRSSHFPANEELIAFE